MQGVEEKLEGWATLRILGDVEDDLGELQVNGCKKQIIRMDISRKGGTTEPRGE
jgi:hypothetical protein